MCDCQRKIESVVRHEFITSANSVLKKNGLTTIDCPPLVGCPTEVYFCQFESVISQDLGDLEKVKQCLFSALTAFNQELENTIPTITNDFFSTVGNDALQVITGFLERFLIPLTIAIVLAVTIIIVLGWIAGYWNTLLALIAWVGAILFIVITAAIIIYLVEDYLMNLQLIKLLEQRLSVFIQQTVDEITLAARIGMGSYVCCSTCCSNCTNCYSPVVPVAPHVHYELYPTNPLNLVEQ